MTVAYMKHGISSHTFVMLIKLLFAFLLCGAAYILLELIWRGRSHISMFLAAGFASAILCGLFMRYRMPLIAQYALGGIIITAIEFITGYIVNIRLKLNVWDYSKKRYNLYGQICLSYSLGWATLVLPITALSNALIKFP